VQSSSVDTRLSSKARQLMLVGLGSKKVLDSPQKWGRSVFQIAGSAVATSAKTRKSAALCVPGVDITPEHIQVRLHQKSPCV
jgi:hypothetical protein